MTIEIIIVHPPDYNEQANLPVVSLLSLRKKDGLSMGFKHNRVLTAVLGMNGPVTARPNKLYELNRC